MYRILQSRIVQRFWNFVGATSIRVKVLGIVVGLVLILGILVTVQMRHILRPALTDQLEEQGRAISDQLVEHINEELAKLFDEHDFEYVETLQNFV